MIVRGLVRALVVGLALSMPVAWAIALAIGVTNSLYGFYAYLVPHSGSEIVVSSVALAPFTSLLNLGVLKREARGIEGLHVVPEVMVLAMVRGRAVIVRGVEPIPQRYGDAVKVLGHCLFCCLVGRELAKELGARPGSVIIVQSVFQRVSVPLRVVGYVSRAPYGFEILVPIGVARVLRATSRGYASIAYVSASSVESLEELAKRLGASVPKPLLERALLALEYVGREARARLFESASEAYLSRLGISRGFVIALDVSLSAIIAAGLFLAGYALPRAIEGEARALRIVGVSRARILAHLALALLSSVAISWVATYVALALASPEIRVLDHLVALSIDPTLWLVTAVVAYAIALAGLAKGCERYA